MRRELNIKVVIEGDKLGSIVERIGFEDTIENEFLILGIIENLKDIQKEKIKVAKHLTSTKK